MLHGMISLTPFQSEKIIHLGFVLLAKRRRPCKGRASSEGTSHAHV